MFGPPIRAIILRPPPDVPEGTVEEVMVLQQQLEDGSLVHRVPFQIDNLEYSALGKNATIWLCLWGNVIPPFALYIQGGEIG